MNTFRKLSVLALIAIIAVVALGVSPTREKASAQDTTIVIWHSWQDAEGDLLDAWVEAFTAVEGNPGVETRFIPFDDLRSTYENAVATGEGPDLLIGQADWAGGLADAGLILPLSEEIADTELESNLTEAAWGLMAYKDVVYGVPVTRDGVSLYYNRDFIEDDEVPTTFEEMVELGAELTEGDDVGLLFNNGFYHSAGIYFGLGGQLFDNDGNNLWNTDEAAVGYLEAHLAVYEANEAMYTGSNTLFREGRAGMIVDGIWNLGTYRADLGDRLGVALLPDVAEDSPWSPFVGGKGFYVSNITANAEAVLQFLTFVTMGEQLQLGIEIAGHAPPSPNVVFEDELVAQFNAQFELGTPLPTSPLMNNYWGPCGNAITGVTERGESAEDAAAAAQEAIEEALAGASS